MNNNELTVHDVARILGISTNRVHSRRMWLKATKGLDVGRKVGNMYIFDMADVEMIRPGKPGRPPKYR